MIIEAREDTITLRGHMLTDIWPAIQAAAALLLEDHPTGIIIDASGLDSCSPEGGVTFVEAFGYIASHNARIVVTGIDQNTLENIKQVPGVRSQLPFAASIEEARASLALEEITPQRGKARIAALVPLVGSWQRAIFHARKLSIGESCEIHLLDLIKVPRNLPIGTPLPDREAAGKERLEKARQLIKDERLKVFTHIERTRSYRDGTAAFVQELNANFVVLSIDPTENDEPFIEDYKGVDMLQTVDYELTLVQSAPQNMEQACKNVVIPAVGEWKHAAEHACKIVYGTDAKVNVVHEIVVPRSEALDAPKPDAESVASDSAAEAARIGKRYGVHIDFRIERVRDPIVAFTRLLEPLDTDMVVIGIGAQTTDDYSITKAMIDELVRNTRCETVLLRTES